MKVQIGDGMSGIQFYFDIWQNWVGRFVSSTCLRYFTHMITTKEYLPLEGGCTPGILKSNRNGAIEIFPMTLNIPHCCKAPVKIVVGFCITWAL
jgi:hypothetical protein